MKHLVTIIILTLTLNCFGQRFQFDRTKISSQTKTIVAKIEKENMLMGSAVGNAGVRPKQFDNFTKLQRAATKIELQELTNHPNGVVRCYSFWALTYDTSINLLPIIIKHIPDDENVSTMFGCIVSGESVEDFFINLVTPDYVDINSKKLDSAEFTMIDSILIYTPNNLYAKQKAIRRTKLTERLYVRVRDLVIKDKNQEALVTLAKYQKERDIPLILKNKIGNKPDDGYFFTYRAISEFPHPDFFPLLERNLKQTLSDDHFSTEWRELYKAIASYENNKAVELLTIPFTQVKHENIREYHIDFIFGALQKFQSPLYDDLLWNIWANEKKISPEAFKYLSAKNPQRAFGLTKETLQLPEDYDFTNDLNDYENMGNSENLLETMLDIVLNQDRPFAIKIIGRNLLNEDISTFQFFAGKAAQIKDTSFVGQLFIRLEKDDNPHIYLRAAEALIAFNIKDINKRIAVTNSINRNLTKGWGGEEFTKLLKGKNIK